MVWTRCPVWTDKLESSLEKSRRGREVVWRELGCEVKCSVRRGRSTARGLRRRRQSPCEVKCSVRRGRRSAARAGCDVGVSRLMTSAWRPELLSLPSCSTLPISTVNLDIATSPFLISDVLENKSFSTDAFSKDGKRKVALSENPLPWAPLKWANKTLVRPAERNVSFSNAIAHLRTCRQQQRHSYLRTWALDSLPKFAARCQSRPLYASPGLFCSRRICGSATAASILPSTLTIATI